MPPLLVRDAQTTRQSRMDQTFNLLFYEIYHFHHNLIQTRLNPTVLEDVTEANRTKISQLRTCNCKILLVVIEGEHPEMLDLFESFKVC